MNWPVENKSISFFLTDRHEGVGKHPYWSNNLALHVGDDPVVVAENRNLLAGKHGLASSDFVFMNQVHGTDIQVVGEDSMGPFTCDGMVTNCPNKVLMVMVADCVPVLFADEEKQVIGVAHAGWRGTVSGIASGMIDKMGSEYGCEPHSIKVWLGPCIKQCCYSVGNEVGDAVNVKNPDLINTVKRRGHRMYFDQHEYNKQLLLKAGLLEGNITVDNTCVSCCVDSFFSYRAEGGVTGRFAAGIWIGDHTKE